MSTNTQLSPKAVDLLKKFHAFEQVCMKMTHCRNSRHRDRLAANKATIRRAIVKALKEVQ